MVLGSPCTAMSTSLLLYMIIIMPLIQMHDNYNQFMIHLRTLDPLKALKGKLNFLKNDQQPLYQALRLLNSLSAKKNNQSQQSSLSRISVQDIKVLESKDSVSQYAHSKMLFEAQVHRHSNENLPVGTVLQQLDKHQKRLVLALIKHSDKLNVKQMAYLNYAVRLRLNALYPNWKNLHFNPESPLRKQFGLLPSLQSAQNLHDIKVMPKKKVTTAIIANRKVEEPEPVKQAPLAKQAPAKGGKPDRKPKS